MFHNFVDNIKYELFKGTAEVLFRRLDSAAEAVGEALEEAVSALAEKVRPTSLNSLPPRPQRAVRACGSVVASRRFKS